MMLIKSNCPIINWLDPWEDIDLKVELKLILKLEWPINFTNLQESNLMEILKDPSIIEVGPNSLNSIPLMDNPILNSSKITNIKNSKRDLLMRKLQMPMDPLKFPMILLSSSLLPNSDLAPSLPEETTSSKLLKLLPFQKSNLSSWLKEDWLEEWKNLEISEKDSAGKLMLWEKKKLPGLCVPMILLPKLCGWILSLKLRDYSLNSLKENLLKEKLFSEVEFLPEMLIMTKLDLMVNLSQLKSMSPPEKDLMDIGNLYKIGLHVPLPVEEEPKPFIENAFPLLKEEKIVLEKPFLLNHVMNNLVRKQVKLHLKNCHLWLKSWKSPTDLRPMKLVLSKKEIWISSEMI